MSTPETDDLARGNHVVPVEWAQQLERERNEAQEKYATEATEHMLAINKLANERDEAREDRDTIQTELEMWRDGNIMHQIHRDELEKTERQRDEAVEEVRLLKGILDVLKKEAQ
jgi:hypothetical protein